LGAIWERGLIRAPSPQRNSARIEDPTCEAMSSVAIASVTARVAGTIAPKVGNGVVG
jgi:hypothetical protein